MFSVTSLQVIACTNEQYLVIDYTKGNIADEKLFANTALDFMYDLPIEQQPKADRERFQGWDWTQSKDLKTMDGRVKVATQMPDVPNRYHYWEVRIKKTKEKGLFVSWWKEHNYNPWII